MFSDSKSAISIAENPVFHEKTKHFELDLHFLREKVSSKFVEIIKVTSDQQTADIFTKGLYGSQHDLLCSKLSLTDMFSKSN